MWRFTHAGPCTIRLDPSVYLENTRPEPIASRQIVLAGRATHPATTLRWRLARDRATPAFTPGGQGRSDPETLIQGRPR
jgi:hypothetical protein